MFFLYFVRPAQQNLFYCAHIEYKSIVKSVSSLPDFISRVWGVAERSSTLGRAANTPLPDTLAHLTTFIQLIRGKKYKWGTRSVWMKDNNKRSDQYAEYWSEHTKNQAKRKCILSI